MCLFGGKAQQKNSFDELIKRLTKALLLVLPDISKYLRLSVVLVALA
jgi:hypothetical protein